MEFREMLQRSRRARGWSQEDLAERLQVSRQAVSKWETGDAQPDLAKLLALADALELPLDVLCGREVPTGVADPKEAAAPCKAKGAAPVWLVVLCSVLAVCLLAVSGWAWSRRAYVPARTAEGQSALLEGFGVTGVQFYAQAPGRVQYQFVPNVTCEGLRYQMIFVDEAGSEACFDAVAENGVCSGTAELNASDRYMVVVSVSDGSTACQVAVAADFVLDADSVTWVPLEENM